jgi:PAS domain S-box-containing protein
VRVLKKRRKAERGRPRRKREGASSRSIATTSDDRALQESAGKTVGFQAIITDITERKRTEEALRVSEEKHRTLFETMMQGVVYQDSNGRIVSANPAAERILGLTLDQMQGRTSMDPRWKAIHEDGSDFPGETHPSMVALKTDKEVRNVVMGVFNPNSEEYRWININAVPQFKPGEAKPFQAYTTFEDITERKRMEEEIRGLARFPSENPNPVLRLNKDGVILTANPASKLLLQDWGSDVGQVAPKSWRDVATDALSTGQSRNIDVESGGKPYTFLVKPIMEAGYVNLYGRDITERKQMEEELRESSIQHATLASVLERFVLSISLKEIFEESVKVIKDYTRCSSVGIRILDDQGNIPYEAYVGFPTKFYESESPLSVRSDKCMCINVIKGDFDPSKPFFTANGSFYSNGTSKLLATVSEEEKGETRNVCNQFGYESVGLIPIRLGGRIIGLIHIGDEKENMVPLEKVQFMEKVASQIAGAIEKARLTTELEEAEKELKKYSGQLEKLVFERTKNLAESERRFRELSDLLPQIVFEIDENGNVQFMNRAAFAATGLSEEDYRRGLNASDMLASAEHDRAVRGMRRIMGGEMIGEREFTVLRRDGTAFPVIVYTAPILREGKSAGLRGIAVDITDRKRAEMELRGVKERLDYVVTSNPAVIFSAKPRADYSDYNVAYMSDRVVEMLGFEPRQFIGHPEFWDAHVHPDDLRRYPMEVSELWKEGQSIFEYRFLHKDGVYRWIREEAKVIRDVAGKPVEVMGYWIDVTERKRMEELLAEARRLAAIGETAAMVGHDLRNPLQAIVSTIYLAKRELESQIEPSKKPAVKPGLVAMLETIENESQYMNKIVSDLQDYATPLKAEPKPVQMESLVRDTLLKIRIPQNVKVSFEVSEALQTVTVDPATMRRVFSNLIMNAIQAMPDGGELTIDLSRTEEHLLVSFRDTGVGIPEENLGKLFNPFFTTKSKGQGLGLPVCKKLVEAQNGRITVESKPGEGSTFTVKLPLVKP